MDSPHKGSMRQNFYILFDVAQNKLLNRHLSCQLVIWDAMTLIYKQQVLTPGHQGWNDLHSLCRIGMEYYLLNNNNNSNNNNNDNNNLMMMMMIMIIIIITRATFTLKYPRLPRSLYGQHVETVKQSGQWNSLGIWAHAEDEDHETVRPMKQSRYSWLSGGYVVVMYFQ